MASSSALGPATPQEAAATAFSRGRPNPRYQPPGLTPAAGQASSAAATNMASDSSLAPVPAHLAATTASGSNSTRLKYAPPSEPLARAAAGSSGAHSSSTGRSNGGSGASGNSSQAGGTPVPLHVPQSAPSRDGSSAQQAQVPWSPAASEAAAAAVRAVNGTKTAGSTANASRQPASRAAIKSASTGSSQPRDSPDGHAQPSATAADLPPGLHARAVTSGSSARARVAPSAANAAAVPAVQNSRHPGTAQGSSVQSRQAQQARQRGAPEGTGSSSQNEQQRLHADHIKPLVGPVVKVDNQTKDATHAALCSLARQQKWQYYLDVRGTWDNICFHH